MTRLHLTMALLLVAAGPSTLFAQDLDELVDKPNPVEVTITKPNHPAEMEHLAKTIDKALGLPLKLEITRQGRKLFLVGLPTSTQIVKSTIELLCAKPGDAHKTLQLKLVVQRLELPTDSNRDEVAQALRAVIKAGALKSIVVHPEPCDCPDSPKHLVILGTPQEVETLTRVAKLMRKSLLTVEEFVVVPFNQHPDMIKPTLKQMITQLGLEVTVDIKSMVAKPSGELTMEIVSPTQFVFTGKAQAVRTMANIAEVLMDDERKDAKVVIGGMVCQRVDLTNTEQRNLTAGICKARAPKSCRVYTTRECMGYLPKQLLIIGPAKEVAALEKIARD